MVASSRRTSPSPYFLNPSESRRSFWTARMAATTAGLMRILPLNSRAVSVWRPVLKGSIADRTWALASSFSDAAARIAAPGNPDCTKSRLSSCVSVSPLHSAEAENKEHAVSVEFPSNTTTATRSPLVVVKLRPGMSVPLCCGSVQMTDSIEIPPKSEIWRGFSRYRSRRQRPLACSGRKSDECDTRGARALWR